MLLQAQDQTAATKFKARITGSALAGICELALFYPVDTLSKRLMNSPLQLSRENYLTVIFQDKANASFADKAKAMFPGIGYGALYKVSQRVYKFGGQPFVNDLIQNRLFAGNSKRTKTEQFWTNAVAGSLVGAGEVTLLPFDVLKIKSQVNPEYRKMPFLDIVKREGFSGLYAGAGITAMRNMMGSFMLFGVNSYVKQAMKDNNKSSGGFLQLVASSTAGSVSSILVACPLDVVKTRMQSGNYTGKSALQIISDISKNEGLGAFFKGAVPKVFTVGPKLIFSFTLAQYLITMFSSYFRVFSNL